MGRFIFKKRGNFISILSDGKFHETVPEGTAGAVKREYETSTGEKGHKWEHTFDALVGKISAVEFNKSDYGDQIRVHISYDGGTDIISQNLNTRFATDLMKKLCAVEMEKDVNIKPYAFKDKNGRDVRGVSIEQDGKKIPNPFWDADKNEPANGFPKVKGAWEDLKDSQKKKYFIDVEEFLVEKVNQKFGHLAKAAFIEESKFEYPTMEADPDAIPF